MKMEQALDEDESEFDYDEVREKLTRIGIRQKSIEQSVAHLVRLPDKKLSAPAIRSLAPPSIPVRARRPLATTTNPINNSSKFVQTEKLLSKRVPPTYVLPSNKQTISANPVIALPVFQRRPPETRGDGGLKRILDRAYICLDQLGGYSRVGMQIGLLAAGAGAALVKDEYGTFEDILNASLVAGHCARMVCTVVYSDELLCGIAATMKLEPVTALFVDHARTLSEVDQELESFPASVALSLSLTSMDVLIRDQSDREALAERLVGPVRSSKVKLSEIRAGLVEACHSWRSSRSLRFLESALMAIQDAATPLITMKDSDLIVRFGILAAVLVSAWNVSRRQSMGISRIGSLISLMLSTRGKGTLRKGEIPVDIRSACIGAAAAMDEFWNRFRSVSLLQGTARPSHSEKAIEEEDDTTTQAMLRVASQYPGPLGQRLSQGADVLIRLAKSLKKDRIEMKDMSARQLVQAIRILEANTDARANPVEIAINALAKVTISPSPTPAIQSEGATSLNRGKQPIASSAQPIPPVDSQTRERIPRPDTVPIKEAGVQQTRMASQPRNRLYDDWTSESSSSWLSENGDMSEDEFSRSFTSRLTDARAVASRYGLFQTTHPEDVSRFLEPLPPQ